MYNSNRILFICSGNKQQGISPIVSLQAESIRKLGMEVDVFPIVGKGVIGYLKHIIPLRKRIKNGNYQALHAHYSWCGIITAFAVPVFSPIIVSLMGSFSNMSFKYYLIRFFYSFFWKAVIVKSEKMYNQISLKDAHIIPNGVDLDAYDRFSERAEIRKKIGFSDEKKYVVFVSDPGRPEKNFMLCSDAVEALKDSNIKLIPVFNMKPEEVIEYHLAADVLMLTSFNEGSPNVIKEAMAACTPIVATNVGDVKHVLGSTQGCFVLNSFEVDEAVGLLRKALDFNMRTKGRDRIKLLGIDARNIAKKIQHLYNLNNEKN